MHPKCVHYSEYNEMLEEMYKVYKILFEIQQNDINMEKYFNTVNHITDEFLNGITNADLHNVLHWNRIC